MEDVAKLQPQLRLLREMAEQLGPLTGTSANIAGREECHTADEVRSQLGESVDFIVDARCPRQIIVTSASLWTACGDIRDCIANDR